ncbi:sugar ABC transporter substrate-binding protein [Sinorhizobium numidicum]|uniref:Sugar ABC transporter substrate-binding protein n=1 Tax=Sinorhizobium numidicum TaxID=680248 RepID=A0ABY8CPY0_9HYPH|nr:sugar ABC transporter substrate-binding protein [Sinorhizobium numidicum]WEX74713.1 sugar ABC transporter substrate-binding protein [Sinorhizobium numidicum]WEX80705.1 sugar ABC transporter substrate-binding protein [Sinorhizobium numidicum]
MQIRKLLAAAAVALGLAAQPALAQNLTLEFVVWNYSLETIQDNVRLFEEANPGIKVNITDYAWPDYHDSLILRIRSKTPTDVVYGGQDWLPAWAAAGFIAPLDSVAPAGAIEELSADIAGFALTDVTYDGKVYGLPYYSDTISFIYNKKILKDAGIAVPATWEEVTAAAEQLKAGGMDKPIIYEYNQELPNFYDAFVAQSYGRGAELFDAELNPLFADPENGAYKQLEWIADAYAKGLVQSDNHESTIITAMNTGKHAFTIVFTYVLAALNDAATQPLAGQFALAPMPGEKHSTLGFAKSYVVTATTAADPVRAEAAWKFVNFMAGKPYTVAKRWAVEKGLGFAQLPLFEDQDVITAWGKWADVGALGAQASIAKAGTYTEFSSIWSAYFRPLLAQAMVGEAPVDRVMKDGAQRWTELKEKFASR